MAPRRSPETLPELPDPDVPLIPWGSSSALTDPNAERRAAAWHGALAAGLPALALAYPIRGLGSYLGSTIAELANVVAPGFLVPYLVLGAMFLAPALLALPVALTGAAAVRSRARKRRELGMAAAAGAGMGTSAVCLGAVALQTLTHGEFLLVPLWLVGVALTIGVVGGSAFAAVPRESGKPDDRPPLYAGLMAAGVGTPALLTGGGAWACLSYLAPVLSPWWLASLVASGALVSSLGLTMAMIGLAPVTYLSARLLGRSKSPAKRGAVALGLLFPPLVPFLALFGVLVLHLGEPVLPVVTAVLGGLLAFAAHAGAAVLGVGSSRANSPELLESA